jgi:hypothetical protein
MLRQPGTSRQAQKRGFLAVGLTIVGLAKNDDEKVDGAFDVPQ